MFENETDKITDFYFEYSGFSRAYILRGQVYHDHWISPSILLCIVPEQDFSGVVVKIWNPDISDLNENKFRVSFDKNSENSDIISCNTEIEIYVKSNVRKNVPVLLSIDCGQSYIAGGNDTRLLGVILQEVKLV